MRSAIRPADEPASQPLRQTPREPVQRHPPSRLFVILFELLGTMFARRSGVDVEDGFCLISNKEKAQRHWEVSEVKEKSGIRHCVVALSRTERLKVSNVRFELGVDIGGELRLRLVMLFLENDSSKFNNALDNPEIVWEVE